MSGSEKQIAWGEKIKAGKIAQLEAIIAKGPVEVFGKPDRLYNEILARLPELKANDDARFWIDNKDVNFANKLAVDSRRK